MLRISELPKVVVIFRGYEAALVRSAVDCLVEAGFSAFEVTWDSPAPLATLSGLREAYSRSCKFGLGTVRDVEQIGEAASIGCDFIISPHCDASLIDAAHDHQMLAIPGALTPSEIQRAWDLGADVVKLFPIAPLGAEYIRQVRAPLSDIPLMATGGTVAGVARDCVTAGCQFIGVGVDLLAPEALRVRDWQQFLRGASSYLSAVTG